MVSPRFPLDAKLEQDKMVTMIMIIMIMIIMMVMVRMMLMMIKMQRFRIRTDFDDLRQTALQ